jgi:hypothetical protein
VARADGKDKAVASESEGRMSKFYIEIDASGFEAPCDEGQWLGYGLIVAEGDSLEECLESASVDLIDQDGGEFAMREADSDEMQDAVEKAFMAKYPPAVTA